MGIYEEKDNRECAEAAYWMLYYPDHIIDYEKALLSEMRLNIILSTPPPRAVLGGKNSVRAVSDTTGTKAMKLLVYSLDNTAGWLKLCLDVEKSLSLPKRVFLDLRRKYRKVTHNEGWLKMIEVDYPEALAEAMGKDVNCLDERYIKDRRTYREWWDRIKTMTAREASRRGLFQ